jgi:arylsulfatase A-like enzyme
MKAIMVMFDSLNRHMLPPYGCEWVHAPNFERLAQRTVTFDTCYVGSMPCMPARRELHTGRYNFLHRCWGPLEPFDDSMPEILKQKGIYTHLVSDHHHYWEDGGATYHTRYNTWEIERGQEGDAWKGLVGEPETAETPDTRSGVYWRQGRVNRRYLQNEVEHPQIRTFQNGLEFMRTNHARDRWFLHIEVFDPHEPFISYARHKAHYPHDYDGPELDWPAYRQVTETPQEVEHIRCEYAALVSMCDDSLGKVLDLMDDLDLWKDTLLIVNTDHGFLLGEHGWWAKIVQPFYNEVAHSPLFIWDPRCRRRGERRRSLVQMIDMAPTLLGCFGLQPTPDMQGRDLRDTIASDQPVREAALFGVHSGHVNLTDGRFAYMRAPVCPENEPLYEYTLMPTLIRGFIDVAHLRQAEYVGPFSFTKGCRVLKVKSRPWTKPCQFGHLLFDLMQDPGQEHPIQDARVESQMLEQMIGLMRWNDAPPEQFERLGLADCR